MRYISTSGSDLSNFRFAKNSQLPVWGRKRKSKSWRCNRSRSTLYTLKVSWESVHGSRRSEWGTLKIRRVLVHSQPITRITMRLIMNLQMIPIRHHHQALRTIRKALTRKWPFLTRNIPLRAFKLLSIRLVQRASNRQLSPLRLNIQHKPKTLRSIRLINLAWKSPKTHNWRVVQPMKPFQMFQNDLGSSLG